MHPTRFGSLFVASPRLVRTHTPIGGQVMDEWPQGSREAPTKPNVAVFATYDGVTRDQTEKIAPPSPLLTLQKSFNLQPPYRTFQLSTRTQGQFLATLNFQ